jgi:hypothetical protein
MRHGALNATCWKSIWATSPYFTPTATCAPSGLLFETRAPAWDGRSARPDAWMAASALLLPAPLVTNNPNDYRHLDNLQLVSATAT